MTEPERELINEKFKSTDLKISSSHEIILEKLINIEKQTTRTNGTVLEHTTRIGTIETELLEYKIIKKYPRLFLIGISIFVCIFLLEFLNVIPGI